MKKFVVTKTMKVPELGIEVEIEVHDKKKSFNQIKKFIPKGWRLMTVQECIFLANKKEYAKPLKMDGSSLEDDFFIEQPFELNRTYKLVARFGADSGGADLNCNWVLDYSYSSLGVRLVRSIKT